MEKSTGYHLNTSIYPICATGVVSSHMEIEIVINGLIVKDLCSKKTNNSAPGSGPYRSKLQERM